MILLNREIITVKELSEEIGLTEKTTRARLNLLDQYLQEHQLGSIQRKTRIGVWLEMTIGKEPEVMDLIADATGTTLYNAQSSFAKMIKLFLLRPEATYTLAQLSEKLYLSVPTVSKLVEEVEQWFARYEIELKRQTNRGHWLEFEESQYRTALINFIFEHVEREHLIEKVDEMLYGNDWSFINATIIDVERDWGIKLNDQSFLNLALSLSISIYRLKQDKPVSQVYDSAIRDYNEYYFISSIIHKIEARLQIEFPETEKYYHVFQLLGSSRLLDLQQGDVEEKIVRVVKRMIETIGSVINMDLSTDEMLAKGLQLHLKPAIFRMRYGIRQKNDQYMEIRQEYPDLFKAVWSTSIILDEEYQIHINEGEIAYITLYIQAAIERHKHALTVLLVSTKSNAQNHLLIEKLKQLVFGDKTIDLVSYHAITPQLIDQYELVLTTDNFNANQDHVVRINAMLTHEDVRMMNKAINEILLAKSRKQRCDETICHHLFAHDLILKASSLEDKQQAISLLLDALEEKGAISPRYRKSVFQREQLTQTSIGDFLAIPHGNQNEVHEPKVAILVLDKPVYWGDGEWVNIVLLLAMKMKTNEDELVTRKFYERYLRLLSKPDVNEQLKAMSNVDIYKFLVRQENI